MQTEKQDQKKIEGGMTLERARHIFDRNPDGSIDMHEYLFVVVQAQLDRGGDPKQV